MAFLPVRRGRRRDYSQSGYQEPSVAQGPRASYVPRPPGVYVGGSPFPGAGAVPLADIEAAMAAAAAAQYPGGVFGRFQSPQEQALAQLAQVAAQYQTAPSYTSAAPPWWMASGGGGFGGVGNTPGQGGSPGLPEPPRPTPFPGGNY